MSGDQPELLALLHTPTRGEGTSREPQKNVAASLGAFTPSLQSPTITHLQILVSWLVNAHKQATH